jgi:TldD protein
MMAEFPERNSMLERLRKKIAGVDADFADIRYEVKREARITCTGQGITEAGSNTTDGYVVRVLKNSGFAQTTVTREEDIHRGLALALEGAEVIAASGGKKTEFADVPPVEADVRLELKGDPAQVPLTEKVALLDGYRRLVLEQEEIATTNLTYREIGREKYYCNSEGTAVHEDILTTNIIGEAVAGRGDLLQNVRIAVGGADGYHSVVGREDLFLERTGIARELLDAEPVKAGTYNVVVNPSLSGVFTHEAFGHFSEADIIEDNPTLREKMSLGALLGNDLVSIIADSTIPGQIGLYRYDDEGVPVKPVTLMEKGVLTGRLHSRRTAAEFSEPVTGHAVAEDHRWGPIIRMGTIFIVPGQDTLEDLLRKLGDGLYLLDAKGGQTSGENFTFGAQYGYRVENGKTGGMIRDINIMGNLFTTLKNIRGVSNEMVLSERGGCGKGQLNIKSATGGPSLLIRDMVVGGV